VDLTGIPSSYLIFEFVSIYNGESQDLVQFADVCPIWTENKSIGSL
jgi:hypothetical protein